MRVVAWEQTVAVAKFLTLCAIYHVLSVLKTQTVAALLAVLADPRLSVREYAFVDAYILAGVFCDIIFVSLDVALEFSMVLSLKWQV